MIRKFGSIDLESVSDGDAVMLGERLFDATVLQLPDRQDAQPDWIATTPHEAGGLGGLP